MKDFLKKNIYNIISILIIIGLLVLAYMAYKNGMFDSVESFRKYVLSFGPWAFIIYFISNIISVLIPSVPGGVIQAFGVVTFGPVKGIIYNYLSVCIGSMIAFFISRSFGQSLVVSIFGEDKFNKYKDKIKEDKYEKFFKLAILFPLAPDNVLCYLSGLSKMTFKQFALIIFLFKPPSIILYSLAWHYGINFLINK